MLFEPADRGQIRRLVVGRRGCRGLVGEQCGSIAPECEAGREEEDTGHNDGDGHEDGSEVGWTGGRGAFHVAVGGRGADLVAGAWGVLAGVAGFAAVSGGVVVEGGGAGVVEDGDEGAGVGGSDGWAVEGEVYEATVEGAGGETGGVGAVVPGEATDVEGVVAEELAFVKADGGGAAGVVAGGAFIAVVLVVACCHGETSHLREKNAKKRVRLINEFCRNPTRFFAFLNGLCQFFFRFQKKN